MKEIVFANVRHALAGAAIGKAMWGYTVSGSEADMLGGTAVFALSVLWSILQKKGVLPA
jgi:hypothetical protein